MKHRIVRISAAAALAAGFLATAAQAADGRYRDFVIGDRASGMGGAGIAIARSVDAVYYNPAGLTESKHDSLSLSANLYGFESFRQRNALYPGEDASSSSFVTIPTAVGGVRRFSDEWVCGFGVFTPDNDKSDFIVSKANGTHLYTLNSTDQTLWFGPAVGWRPSGDSPFSLGAAVFGVYRSMQLSQSIYHSENGQMTHAYDMDDFGVMGTLGAQYRFGDGWKAGATVQSPNLHLYGDGRRSVSAYLSDEDTQAGVYSDDLDTDNRQALQLGLGVGRSVAGQYAFDFDVTYHPSTSYDLMDWDFGDLYGNDSARVEMNDVVDFSLGGEYYVAENWPVRAGVYTAFSATDVPDDTNDDSVIETDLDLVGFTFSVGRETETMGINVGIEYAFGHGHTLGYKYDDDGSVVNGKTTCRSELLLLSLSTSYYF